MKKAEKITFDKVFAVIFRILLIVAIISGIIFENWINVFTAVLTLIVTFLPYIITKKMDIKLPTSFMVAILSFIFAAQFLGELNSFYYKYWWWDTMLHTIFGITMGFIGFIATLVLNKSEKITLSPVYVAVFSFTLSLAAGTIWEIFEFFMDQVFGTNMQKSGLIDTMQDLIVNTIGALFTSIVGYLYLKYERHKVFGKLMDEFINENKDMFIDEDRNNF